MTKVKGLRFTYNKTLLKHGEYILWVNSQRLTAYWDGIHWMPCGYDHDPWQYGSEPTPDIRVQYHIDYTDGVKLRRMR